MILVDEKYADPVLGAEVAQKDRDYQRVGLISGHLHETGGGRRRILLCDQVAEVFSLEKTTRIRACDPRPVAAPAACGGQRIELFVKPFQSMIGQPVNAIVKDPAHGA